MSQVWQATDTQLNRQVALKILPDAFAADPERLARFTREAQILASLNHPNIAAIHGIEESVTWGSTARSRREMSFWDRVTWSPESSDPRVPSAALCRVRLGVVCPRPLQRGLEGAARTLKGLLRHRLFVGEVLLELPVRRIHGWQQAEPHGQLLPALGRLLTGDPTCLVPAGLGIANHERQPLHVRAKRRVPDGTCLRRRRAHVLVD